MPDVSKYGSSVIKCPECRTKFKMFNSRLRKPGLTFCSKECHILHCKKRTGSRNPRWIDRPERFCPICSKQLKKEINRKQVFCSSECASRDHSKQMRKGNNPRWKGGKPIRICKICGKQFRSHIAKRHEQKGYGKYCSLECRGHAELGNNNHAWRGGSSFEPYPHTFNKEFKDAVRKRDDHTCAICGSYGNQIHHIDYNKKHTSLLNCITLCPPCHGHTNANRNYWQSVLSEMVSQL